MSKAFSLIELLVTIAIVAVLAAVATPVYRDYKYRVIISRGYDVIGKIGKEIALGYERSGVWPASITYNGVTITMASTNTTSMTAVNIPPLVSFRYFAANNLVYMDGAITGLDGMRVVHLGNTYTVTNPTPGTYAAFTVVRGAIRSVNGVLERYCGAWSPTDGNDVSFASMPRACVCRNLASAFPAGVNPTGGTISTPC